MDAKTKIQCPKTCGTTQLVNIDSNNLTVLKYRKHGSRTSEKEEEVFHPKGSDEAEVQEGQSSRQSDHRSELVYPPVQLDLLIPSSIRSDYAICITPYAN